MIIHLIPFYYFNVVCTVGTSSRQIVIFLRFHFPSSGSHLLQYWLREGAGDHGLITACFGAAGRKFFTYVSFFFLSPPRSFRAVKGLGIEWLEGSEVYSVLNHSSQQVLGAVLATIISQCSIAQVKQPGPSQTGGANGLPTDNSSHVAESQPAQTQITCLGCNSHVAR